MAELPPTSDPGTEGAPPRRRLSGCAWVVICLVLIVATVGFIVVWPIYRGHVAIKELTAKGAEIGHWANYNDRPWHLSFLDENSFLPGADEVGAELVGAQFTDGDVRHLVALGNFDELKIRKTSLSSDGLRRLGHIRNVGDLTIDHSVLGDDDLQHMLQPHWRIGDLELTSPALTQAAWTSITRCQDLNRLSLVCSGMTLDRDLPDLSSMGQLKFMTLNKMKITATGLKRLGNLPNLRTIRFQNCQLENVDFSGFTKLKTLVVAECRCTPAGLRKLRIPAGVLRVGLYDLALDETDSGLLSGLSMLAGLDLQRSTFTDRHLQELSGCTNLMDVYLVGCTHVGDAQIPLLLAIPNLQILDLTGTSVSQAGVDELKRERPSLKVIHNLSVE